MERPLVGEKYRHFKGNEYEIVCIGKDSETEEEKVVYRDLTDASKVWIRSADKFLDMKETESGEVQRFEKINNPHL